MNRAYCVLEIKATGDANGKRTFKGIATTPTTDSYGDVVEPMGAEFKLPLPMLWQHNSREPIGWVTSAKATKAGIEVEGEIAALAEPASLKDRLDNAWAMLKGGLVRGLSIGFNGIESARIDGTYGIHWLKWAWLELSAVTIPANMDASITAIRSADTRTRAASGLEGSGSAAGARSLPASGPQSRTKGANVKTLQQMIEERTSKSARMGELVALRETEKRAFSAAERAEMDTLDADVSTLDDDIVVSRFHERQAASASRVGGGGSNEGSQSRSGPTIIVKNEDPEDQFKGQAYTRFLIAKAMSWMEMQQGNFISPVEIAKHRWGRSHPKLVKNIQAYQARAAVAGGGTGSGEWGAELAQSDRRFDGDFIEFLYGATIFDKIALRPVPGRTHIKGQDGAATGYWVGESKAIPFSKPDFSDVEVLPLKVGAISGCSKELIRAPGSGAEQLIRDSIVQASAQRVDTTFVSQTAASAGVSPAGIGNGLSAITPSGADAAAVRTDLMTLYLPFLSAKNASGLVHIMTPSMAKAISLMVNSLGFKEFPELKATGGMLEGDPVYTGDNVAGGDWYLLKPSDIWKIDDQGVEISMSDTATIEQNDAPQGAQDTPTAASATIMSAWQTESVFFKVVRSVDYKLRRTATSVVNLLQNGEYGGVAS